MSGLRVGGLALVIACPQIPENVGCVVELVQHLMPDDLYIAPSNGEIRYSQGEGWLVTGRVTGLGRRQDGTTFREFGHALFSAQRLMPLEGDPAVEPREVGEAVPV